MCGCYYVDDEMAMEIEKIAIRLEQDMKRQGRHDVFPSGRAVVLSQGERGLAARWLNWGFPGYESGKLLINARAEGITDKKTFRDSVLRRRCVIPARGFYEWNPAKEKFRFENQKGNKILYLAGCFRQFQEQDRFVIITTAANETMRPVHHRMPLILDQSEVEEWITDYGMTDRFLKKVPEELKKYTDYEQMSLF